MRPIEAAYNIGAIGRSFAEDATLPGLVTVLSEFHRQRISYCYWKSSRHLQAMFAGEGDVDLLIARDDQHRAQAILSSGISSFFHPWRSMIIRQY